MRRALLLALGLGLGSVAPAAAAAGAVEVVPLAVEMDARDADVLFKKYKYDTSTFPVTIVEPDGQRLTGRIEVKGETARVFAKKPVLIKLGAGQKWRGHARISLNAMATDSSLIREWLSWDLIYALGMVAPKTGYVRLAINGEDRGLFFQVEWVGPKVFERYGFGDDGEMFDPVDRISCADFSAASVADPELCWGKISPRDKDFSSLKRIVAAIEAEPVETVDRFLDREFDADSVINWIAVTVLVENLTTYNNEYWPYYSKSKGKWVIMPWDYDRTFGKNYDPNLPYPRDRINDNFQYYYPVEIGASNALRDKLFKNAAANRRIRDRIREIVDGTPDAAHPWRGWFAPSRMGPRIAALRELLAPEVARDPFLGNLARFDSDVDSVRHFAWARAHYLRTTAFARSGWRRDQASVAVPAAGGALPVFDGWGFLLADLNVRTRTPGGRLDVALWRGRPELVPPGADRAACVQRTWLLTAPAALQADLTVEYLEEASRLSEVGPAVGDERRLQLFLRDGRGWWALPTRVNGLANTLGTASLNMPGGERVRLVACAAPPAPALAAQ